MIQVDILPRILTAALAFALIFMFSYPVLAQEATSTTAGKDRIEQRRQSVEEKMEERKVKMATREAALKVKLEKFRDQKKAEIADRINTNLNKINQKQTGQMLKHLDRISAILGKLEERVNKGTPDIKDTTAAKEAIVSAKEAIATATASVKAQAEKDYTITVSSESTVRRDAQKMREQLHTDLKAVRVQVVDAKQAVANAIRVAKSGKVEVPGKEGTPSGRE